MRDGSRTEPGQAVTGEAEVGQVLAAVERSLVNLDQSARRQVDRLDQRQVGERVRAHMDDRVAAQINDA